LAVPKAPRPPATSCPPYAIKSVVGQRMTMEDRYDIACGGRS
jgi:hypothetical protein